VISIEEDEAGRDTFFAALAANHDQPALDAVTTPN
jgi:hypothetical protein